MQAKLQKVSYPVIDDDNGEDHENGFPDEVRNFLRYVVKNRYICICQFNVMGLSFKQLEKISKALGDSNRLKILNYLSGKGGCGECSALQDVIDLAQPSIPHHVKILLESGLIEGEKEGRNYTYTLNSGVMNEYIESLRRFETIKPLVK